MRQLSPLRVVSTALGAAAGLGDAAGNLAAAGLDVAALPVRVGAKVLSGEVSRSALTRRTGRGDGRMWIEVRGIDDAARAEAVVDALRAQPGVANVSLNLPLSRAVIETDPDGASLNDLCSVLDEVESDCGATGFTRGESLPGDGLLLATRGAMVAANAAAFTVALAGSALRLPAAPIAVEAVSAIANHQPWLRRALEAGIGPGATDMALSVTGMVAHVVTLSPAKLAVDLTMQAFKAAECRAAARAWDRYEPELARHADEPGVHRASRPVRPPAGPIERHGTRAAWAQLIGVGLTGAVTRNVTMASNAALAASPKAMRTTHEAFASTLGRGLADRHAVLALRPEGLRRLDKVDALLIDPRVLCGETMRVVRVRGARDGDLLNAWTRAQELLDDGAAAGWHPIHAAAVDGGRAVEALIAPAVHPLASAMITQARDSGARLVSVDTDLLGDLRPAFDDIRPVSDDRIDDALADAVAELQRGGHTVAVLSSAAARALSAADLALGIKPDADGPPPWHADLMMEDLAAAWRVLHALPAARRASQQGIAISVGASALGALFMVPGVRRLRGPGPVTVGAVAGILSGYLLARRTIGTPIPRPAPAYEWHAMSAERVRDVLATLREPGECSAATEPAPRGARFPGAAWDFVKAAGAELTGDPLTPVLALCSTATAVLGSPADALLVGTVLTGNAMLSTYQQLQAENRLTRLLAQQAPPARLVTAARGYRDVVIEQLRPGDVIEVRSDEVVPADARLIEAHDLEVDESSLTGESLSVQKQVEATPGAELAERRCMIYAGTTVVAGTAVAVVTAVGADTQTRRAAELASGDLPTVGLHHQLSQLMSRAFPFSAGGGVLVGALGLLRAGGLRQALSSAIAVSVAAIPEGMPLMATLAQSASAQRLGEAGALVRVPRAAEALGRVEVVCFDKTGTLSENRLRVVEVHPAAGHSRDDVLRCAAQAAPADDGNPHVHATDEAIIKAADAAASGARSTPDAHLPFRSGRAFSASATGTHVTVKGAPEVVLAACREVDAEVEDAVAALTTAGLRVIAVAQRRLSAQQARSLRDDPDGLSEVCGAELTLTGFLGLSDTPRAQAPQLLADLADRGVAIRLITGDHPVTAAAIARELGVPVNGDQVITGAEWNALSRHDQLRAVSERVIFARMSPENKVQVVQTLERAGRVCAMVGDGANDAAAIRAASVGVGVVARGSDSAHTTADLVLTDGRIETLVDAIDEGRRLWRGVQAAVAGLLGGNAGEVIFSVIGTAITGTSPLNTRQLLLMNMLTDALPATAVAVSTPAGPVQRVGRGIDERALRRAVAARGSITAASATAAWVLASVTGLPRRASTVALISLVAVELGQTVVDSHAPLVLVTAAGSFAAFAAMITTPGISQLLGCTPVGPVGWAQGLGTAAAAILAVAATNRLRSGSRDAESPPMNDDPLPGEQPPGSPDEPPRDKRGRAPHTAALAGPARTAPALKLVDQHQHRAAEVVSDRP